MHHDASLLYIIQHSVRVEHSFKIDKIDDSLLIQDSGVTATQEQGKTYKQTGTFRFYFKYIV